MTYKDFAFAGDSRGTEPSGNPEGHAMRQNAATANSVRPRGILRAILVTTSVISADRIGRFSTTYKSRHENKAHRAAGFESFFRRVHVFNSLEISR